MSSQCGQLKIIETYDSYVRKSAKLKMQFGFHVPILHVTPCIYGLVLWKPDKWRTIYSVIQFPDK